MDIGFLDETIENWLIARLAWPACNRAMGWSDLKIASVDQELHRNTSAFKTVENSNHPWPKRPAATFTASNSLCQRIELHRTPLAAIDW